MHDRPSTPERKLSITTSSRGITFNQNGRAILGYDRLLDLYSFKLMLYR